MRPNEVRLLFKNIKEDIYLVGYGNQNEIKWFPSFSEEDIFSLIYNPILINGDNLDNYDINYVFHIYDLLKSLSEEEILDKILLNKEKIDNIEKEITEIDF
jgi:hypothetical protein